MTRPAYQVRVIAERDELAERIDKLRAFIASDAFSQGVGHAERDRMARQLGHMVRYCAVLDERIEAFRA